jgi:lathosterol oxidase
MDNPIVPIALVVLVLIERIPRLRRWPQRLFRAHFASDLVYLGTGVVALGALTLDLVSLASRGLGEIGLPRLDWAALPFPLVALIATMLVDLGNYASHSLLHRFDALWELHKVHHSSRTLDWLATFRSHILEQVVRRLVAPVGLILLGVPAWAVGVAAAVYTSWAALGHSNLKIDLRVLEPVFITPRLHRLHHVPHTTERNLGTIFSVWDRLRGTLVTDAGAALEPLGVPGEVESYPQGWLPQLLEPLRRMRREVPDVPILG